MNEFIQGYACAIACIIAGHGSDTATREALEAGGITSVKMLREHQVENGNINILKPQIIEIQRRRQREKK